MRTNNNAEAFHSHFNRRIQITHPNMWSFIKFLQGEENRFHHLRIQFYAGLGARPKQSQFNVVLIILVNDIMMAL
ncbi:unnamed protein product [Rotaria socialis]|uniref:Uncharacterized protein n=1 Tax=Rotaria socialis TaxID=392032 RepID=A0A821MIS8_9BILA|nr:unnamed protein product [Rotaria socialis]